MPLYRLMLEDHTDVFPATLGHVQMAVQKMASAKGPTFLNLKDSDGNWAQAGGTNGRYRIEVRDVYGEGFRHSLAVLPGCTDRADTVVYYRNKCIENKHAPRHCPLNCTMANVLTLADVLEIMVQYAVTGTRSDKYLWDDGSKFWLDEESHKLGTIKQIKPKGSKH
jgi:hypothetical protein